jgi:hypothetical protein
VVAEFKALVVAAGAFGLARRLIRRVPGLSRIL